MSGTFEQKPVYIFNDSPFLSLVAVVDDYATLRFKRGWYAPGDFELTINKNTQYADEFVKGRIIRVGDDNTKCGYIDDVTDDVGPAGAASEIRTIRGHELTQWFDRRDVLPPAGQDYYAPATTTPTETIVKNLIKDNFGTTAAASRQDSTLTIATDLARGPAYTLSSRYNNLLKELSDCLLATNGGVYVTLSPSTGKWIVEFGLGTDRTASVVFSTDRETTNSAQLRASDIAYKNVAIVAGQGEGKDRVIRTVWTGSEPTGRSRRELFVDARDLELVASLDKRGQQKLAENQFTQYLKVDALAYSQLVYGVDYFIGDKVTVSQFGVSQQVYITTVEESWKAGFYGLSLGFDRSPPTLTGQVSGVAGTALQTLARIDPVWPSSDDTTLASDSSQELPTVHAVKTYVDKQSINYPTDENVFCKHSFDAIPAITYPDNPVGTTYLQDAWATTDGWDGIASATGDGTLTLTKTGASQVSRKTFGSAVPANSVIMVRARLASGSIPNNNLRMDFKTIGGTFVSGMDIAIPSDGSYSQKSFIITASTVRIIDAYPGEYADATASSVKIDWVYIGDGSYTWQIGDDSGNGNVLVPKGGVSRVTGRSGYAMQFDGTTGYAFGNLSGFADTIHIHRFSRLQAFSATQKMLWESSTDSSATTGAIRLVAQLVSGANRVLVRIKTATSTLGGYIDLASIGDHWFDVLYSRTVTSNSALRLFVKGSEVALTYDFPYSGAGTLPTVYNGPFYIGSRAGTSLFSNDTVDEHEVRTSLPTAEDIQSLYRIPMQYSPSVVVAENNARQFSFASSMTYQYPWFVTLVYTGSASVTLTLYTPSASLVGSRLRVKHSGTGGVLTIVSTGATFDGNANVQLIGKNAVELQVISATQWGVF